MFKKITYLFLVSFIMWGIINIIYNPPSKTTMKHYDILQREKPYTINGKVIKIVNYERIIWHDGKNEIDIYLIGIYVPRNFRSQVINFMKEKLLGQKVDLEFDRQYRDRFGNYYGYIYLKDEMINGMLIKKGLAKSAVVPPNNRYYSQFLQWELDAKRKGVGIWVNNQKKDKKILPKNFL